MSDSINHPAHYNKGKIEVIEFIEDQKMGYNIGNATKYLCRAGVKNPKKIVEDLKKAIWYVNREIELLESKGEGKTPRRPNDMAKMPVIGTVETPNDIAEVLRERE